MKRWKLQGFPPTVFSTREPKLWNLNVSSLNVSVVRVCWDVSVVSCPLLWKWKWKWKLLSCVWLFVTPRTIQSMEFSRPEYWSGSLSLLQGIFPTLGLNSGFLHSRQILYQLSPQASAQILEWVAYPFSSRSFQPRNRTRVSSIAGRFFTSWATREAPSIKEGCKE